MTDESVSPSIEAATPAAEAPEASGPTTDGGTEAPNASQHTEGTPGAQGNEGLLEAQNKFLEMLQNRISDLETLSLVALELKLKGNLAAATSYGALWHAQNRRSFNIVTRIKRRMK